jgi:Mrp family chromosome partitioning ATPase
VEAAFRLPVVAEVPRLARDREGERYVAVATEPRSDIADAYRRVRLAIEHMPSQVFPQSFTSSDGDEDLNTRIPLTSAHDVVLVTSPGPGEGKTTTVANLAACFAEAGKTVAVVDGDVHRPELMDVMLPRAGAGVPDRGPSPLDGLVPTVIDRVWLLPANDPRGASMRSGARRELVGELRRAVDVVIIDTPPLLLSTEAADLAPDCDTVLLVAKSRRTRAAPAERATELLARLGVPVLGVALIGADEALIRGGYRYYYAPPHDAGDLEGGWLNRSGNGNGHPTRSPTGGVDGRPSRVGKRVPDPESSP